VPDGKRTGIFKGRHPHAGGGLFLLRAGAPLPTVLRIVFTP